MSYSEDGGANYDHEVLDFTGKELYVKMIVRNDSAYLTDCFLSNTYTMDSFEVPAGITVNRPFTVGVTLSYEQRWMNEDGPRGNIYLSLLKDGNEVATSELCEVQLHTNEVKTYEMQLMAPAEWGKYELMVSDECGNRLVKMDGWYSTEEAIEHILILPVCQRLVEDFESMTANSSTNDKNVPGNFTTWTFYKSGVRAPGEGKCNGTNSVMMKKPSYLTSVEPIAYDFFLAQAAFFNPTSSDAKYKLTYSTDNGTTWETAYTYDGFEAVEVPGKSQMVGSWLLNLSSSEPALFRITMFGGGTSATYVDDFSLYYTESGNPRDVNGDGEVNISDINAVIDIILSGNIGTYAADVNRDGEVNISDVSDIIDAILY